MLVSTLYGEVKNQLGQATTREVQAPLERVLARFNEEIGKVDRLPKKLVESRLFDQ